MKAEKEEKERKWLQIVLSQDIVAAHGGCARGRVLERKILVSL